MEYVICGTGDIHEKTVVCLVEDFIGVDTTPVSFAIVQGSLPVGDFITRYAEDSGIPVRTITNIDDVRTIVLVAYCDSDRHTVETLRANGATLLDLCEGLFPL